MRPAALLLLVLAVSGARRSSAAAFADRTALKTAVDNCLAKVSSGFQCCSRAVDFADCRAAGTTDMRGWNVALVADMNELFEDKTAFNQNIGGWDVSGVTSMHEMFRGASAFNQDIGSWDVSGRDDHVQHVPGRRCFQPEHRRLEHGPCDDAFKHV